VQRTSIDILNSLLLLLASIVLGWLLDRETGLGASVVESAAVVHGFLEGVSFPAEDVVAVSGSSTMGNYVLAGFWLIDLYNNAISNMEVCVQNIQGMTYPRFML
jgi:hypothetical protein